MCESLIINAVPSPNVQIFNYYKNIPSFNHYVTFQKERDLIFLQNLPKIIIVVHISVCKE